MITWIITPVMLTTIIKITIITTVIMKMMIVGKNNDLLGRWAQPEN
jgi:hypothetical protein